MCVLSIKRDKQNKLRAYFKNNSQIILSELKLVFKVMPVCIVAVLWHQTNPPVKYFAEKVCLWYNESVLVKNNYVQILFALILLFWKDFLNQTFFIMSRKIGVMTEFVLHTSLWGLLAIHPWMSPHIYFRNTYGENIWNIGNKSWVLFNTGVND